MRIVIAVGGMLLAAVAVSVPPALQCPDIADAHVATAWQEYRAGRLGNAQSAFASARARCPDHAEAQVGLGYVALRNAELDSARVLFDRVLAPSRNTPTPSRGSGWWSGAAAATRRHAQPSCGGSGRIHPVTTSADTSPGCPARSRRRPSARRSCGPTRWSTRRG
jgi:hypothetical protein